MATAISPEVMQTMVIRYMPRTMHLGKVRKAGDRASMSCTSTTGSGKKSRWIRTSGNRTNGVPYGIECVSRLDGTRLFLLEQIWQFLLLWNSKYDYCSGSDEPGGVVRIDALDH